MVLGLRYVRRTAADCWSRAVLPRASEFGAVDAHPAVGSVGLFTGKGVGRGGGMVVLHVEGVISVMLSTRGVVVAGLARHRGTAKGWTALMLRSHTGLDGMSRYLYCRRPLVEEPFVGCVSRGRSFGAMKGIVAIQQNLRRLARLVWEHDHVWRWRWFCGCYLVVV